MLKMYHICISDNKTGAYKLMTLLKSIEAYSNLRTRARTNNNYDEYIKNDFSKNKEKTEKEKQAEQEEMEDYKRIHDGFAYFYKAKYNKEMSDDMNMLIYLYKTPFLTDEERPKVDEFLNLSIEYHYIDYTAKGYFSKAYIESHPYVTITYTDKNSKHKIVTIDDYNRYIESNQNER